MTQTAKRITHAAAGSWVENAYSTINPFSKDNAYLLLIHQHHFELYSGDGKWLKRLTLSADSEPCWSRTDEHILYYRWNNEVREFDVRTEVWVTLRKFPAPISGRGESDLSNDGDHLVLADDANRIWIYNLRTDQLRGGEVWTDAFNALYILPSNDVLVCAYTGVYLLSDGRKIASTLAHNAVARYQGRDIFIWGSSADAQINANALWAIDVQTLDRRMLLNMEWPVAYHVSACDQDWCIVGTYAPDNSLPSQLLKVRLDGSGSEVLCNTDSVMMKNPDGGMAYNPTPRASVSRDGSRVVFNSNGGVLDRGPNYCDVYMLTLDAVIDRPPKPEPIVITPTPDLELEALRRDNAILRQRLAAHQSLEQNLAAAQEAARVATAQVTGLRRDVDGQMMEIENLRQQLSQSRSAIEVSAAYLRDMENKNADLKRRMDDPHPDPDIWPAIDFLQRGHLPGQRWGFELQETGKLKMFDVIGDERIPIEIPQGNQYLFVQTAAGLEQRERRTNQK